MSTQDMPTVDEELFGDDVPGERGHTRTPKFGEWLRGVWASARNPHRDGMFVESQHYTGKFNPGLWYRLTDGNGAFWSYEAKNTVFIAPPNPQGASHAE